MPAALNRMNLENKDLNDTIPIRNRDLIRVYPNMTRMMEVKVLGWPVAGGLPDRDAAKDEE